MASLKDREMYAMAYSIIYLMNPLMHWIDQEEHVNAYFQCKCPSCRINKNNLRGGMNVFLKGNHLFDLLYRSTCEHRPVSNPRKYVRELNNLVDHYRMEPLPKDRHSSKIMAKMLNKKAR